MKRIIICNTYYQIIFAIQLKHTIFKDDYICLIASDHSKNVSNLVDIINQYGIFDECYYVQTWKIIHEKKKIFGKLKVLLDACFGLTLIYNCRLKMLNNRYYDELISFNYALDVDSYYAYLYRFNKNIICSVMEEGILSYNKSFLENAVIKKRKIIASIRSAFYNNTLLGSMKNFYCYYPNLYLGKLKPVGVPPIMIGSKVSYSLNQLFELRDKLFTYNQKYIFFTSVYDFEGGKPVGEYDLVCKIADLVGKDNLLVKTHPRDTRTIYIDNGFNVDKNSSIPWEAIQLSGDFSDKVFMTINSGSVLSGSTMSEKPVRTYYMYKLCDISGNESCKKNARDIENLLQNEEMKKILKTVHIAEKLEDIL